MREDVIHLGKQYQGNWWKYFVIIKPILRPQSELPSCSQRQDAWWGSTGFCQKPAFHLSLYCKCFKRENLFKTFTTNSVKKANKIYKYIKYSTTNMRSSVLAPGKESCWSLDVDADNSPHCFSLSSLPLWSLVIFYFSLYFVLPCKYYERKL